MSIVKTYGRTTIYANYSEKELLSMPLPKLEEAVIDILRNSIFIHDENSRQTQYLKDYIDGKQDIYTNKEKHTREEIDNRIVENWAYALVDFKSSWLLGKAIQYSLIDSKSEEEISTLNRYCRYEFKKNKDRLLYQDMLIAGRGFRYNAPDKKGEEDEAPFEIINIDADSCEVVYSSGMGHEQLLSYIKTSKKFIYSYGDSERTRYYDEYTVYLRNYSFVINDRWGGLKVRKRTPLLLNEHYITEYYLNPSRISLIEIGKDLFDGINQVESLDMDDLEQYVNALLVFTNVDVDSNDVKDMKEVGAISIASNEQKPAKVEILDQRLNANTTSTFYSRLINALHQILGIPKAGDNGEVSYGDTGQARLTGQGYTSAGIRADGDESMFEQCDLQSMRTILKICKEQNSDIKSLKVSEIDVKFQRNMNENLLVKTQALMNLLESKIPRKYANAIIGLFPDPNAVTEEQNKIFGKENEIQPTILQNGQKTTNIDNNSNEKFTNINNKAMQGA